MVHYDLKGVVVYTMTFNEQVAIAAKLMHVTEEEVYKFSGIIPNTKSLYFSKPQRGGGSLIVDADGSVLYANSAIGFDEHLEAFRQGKRTTLDFFDE